jgi:peroxiredoxin
MSGAGQRYIFISILIAICLIGLLGSGCCAVKISAEVGAQAPDFSLPTTSGDTLTLSDLKGHPVVLIFWYTGCGWCKYQMPFFQTAHEEMGQEITIIAIDIGESGSLIQQFAEYYGYTFTFALDYDGSVMYAYNVGGTPTNFLIDASGVIREIKIGAYLDENDLIEALENLLHS